MDFWTGLLELVWGKYNNDDDDGRSGTVLSVVTATIVVVFAAIGAHHVWDSFFVVASSGSSRADARRGGTNVGGGGSFRGKPLLAVLLAGLAGWGPSLYRTASSRPEFVFAVDRILDGCQSKLREIVVSTASVRDDAVLDTLDDFLDGFQAWLRNELLQSGPTTDAAGGAQEEGNANRRRRKPGTT